MEGSLSPKPLNAIANEHDPNHRTGLQYGAKSKAGRLEITRRSLETMGSAISVYKVQSLMAL
jgi:hypothetical protein